MSAILLRKPLPPSSATIAERLRAHARLCQHIAEQSWSEKTAAKLGRLAEDCAKAARDADSVRQDR